MLKGHESGFIMPFWREVRWTEELSRWPLRISKNTWGARWGARSEIRKEDPALHHDAAPKKPEAFMLKVLEGYDFVEENDDPGNESDVDSVATVPGDGRFAWVKSPLKPWTTEGSVFFKDESTRSQSLLWQIFLVGLISRFWTPVCSSGAPRWWSASPLWGGWSYQAPREGTQPRGIHHGYAFRWSHVGHCVRSLQCFSRRSEAKRNSRRCARSREWCIPFASSGHQVWKFW